MADETKVGLGSAIGVVINSVASPPAKIIGSWLGDIFAIRYSQWRANQAVKVIEGAGEILESLNLQPTACKPKILLSLVEQASLEDDEDLTQKWMGLLASSVIGNSIHPSYPRILSELIQREAKMLDHLYKLENDFQSLKGDKTVEERETKRRIAASFRLKNIKQSLSMDDNTFPPSVDNLLRLRLCEHPESYEDYEVVVGTSLDNDELDVDTQSIANRYIDTDVIRLTGLGKDFVRVCRGPQA